MNRIFSLLSFLLCFGSISYAQTIMDGEQSSQVITVNGVSFTIIKVDGGTFTMGATPEQFKDTRTFYEKDTGVETHNAPSDENPTHLVTLDTFYIGETEVTQALWKAVMGNDDSQFKGDNLPKECVLWGKCHTFIEKLNNKTGLTFRLPTEAEWEYAARGGNKSKGYKFSGSDNYDEVGWYSNNSYGRTNPVKSKKANELGIYDMSGNVSEWCEDMYMKYQSRDQKNPLYRTTGYEWEKDEYHVRRGGSWEEDYCYGRTSARCGRLPNRGYVLGLRLVLDLKSLKNITYLQK